MDIGIVGGGALGLLFASYLTEAGHRVHIWTKSHEQAEEISSKGINRDGTSFHVTASAELFKEPVDAVIVAVKQYQLESVLEQLDPSLPVLFIQNGMGHTEKVLKFHAFPLYAVVTHGAMKYSQIKVGHTGSGHTIFGGNNKTNILAHALLALPEPFSFHWTENVQEAMKKKLIINAVINPLTVIYEDRNQVLLAKREAWDRAQALFKEAAQVLNLPMQEWDQVNRVIELTRENRSSMLVDYLENRPLELDAINGYIIREAERTGRSAPAHVQIVEEIKKKVEQR